MTTHCNEGDNPRVEYRFGGGQKGVYQAITSPIEVTTSEGSPNTYNYFDANLPGNKSFQGTRYELEFRDFCLQGQTRIAIYDGDSIVGSSCMAVGSLQIIPGEGGCKLTVKNSNGQQLFEVTGECPINYEVACGNCPPGYIECKTNKHPGYCCVPCQKTASKINNLATKVHGK
jgi:hypothetical protein